jgi:ABC-2 type transport system ATP-binding protein
MTAAIRVTNLRKRFGEIIAVEDVSFEAAGASVLALLGPNGAGKTTITRVLATILAPDGGTAEIMGRDVKTDPRGVRRLLGLAGQYAAVDPVLTGRENLRLVGRLSRLERHDAAQRASELLERFELTDAADRPVRTYSGGMRRRLDLAAALVHHPPVLLLDEPTTGLDIRSRVELWTMIRELVSDGTAVLLTTQYLEEADRLADDLVVVDHGHVIATGSPAKLKATMGGAVAEVTLADEPQAVRAGELLADAAIASPERDGRELRLSAQDGAGVLLRALRALDAGGIAPVTLALREPSLDDVFLALTGHPTEDSQ